MPYFSASNQACMNRNRIFAALCLVSTFLVYFEWGGGNRAFLWEMELDLFQKSREDIAAFGHPLIILPLIAQILLIVIIALPTARRSLPITAVSLFGILAFIVLLGGVGSSNYKIIGFSLPFIVISSLWLFGSKKLRKD